MEYGIEIDSREKKSVKNARHLSGDKYSNADYCDREMKGWRPGGPDGRSEAEFSTWWRGKDGRYCRFRAPFTRCSGSIFHAETSPNISKFLVIIFACNLHRDV
ncbi:hypothetical protein [Burkholderia cenocepacia]|uniref:hypothetical protein n=1 Tax=Burkholderia cenocepacia TaxID=95486 RepID=UPI0015C56FDE|nr:hypothetical protein [Burkholderia cenocepacia]